MKKALPLLIVCVFQIFNIKAQILASNLPIINFKTTGPIVDDPKVAGTIEIYENGKPTEKPIIYHIGVELRGSSSQQFPKKSLAFETRNEKGENLNVSLLGMPAENDWAIIAPYSDKSIMRDPLTYALSKQMGHYCSNTKYVDVYINNNYYGLCFLAEKIKQGKNRVDISKLKTTDITGDALTGGYIVKIDKTTGAYSRSWQSQFFSNTKRSFFQLEYPKTEDLTSQQFDYIKNYVDLFEQKLQASNFTDKDQGYANMVDMVSFADFFLLNELARNIDGYRLSTYFYKDKDSKNSKLVMGPIWDFNLAYGNADYCNGWLTTGWAYKFYDVCSGDPYQIPFWFEKMLKDKAFQNVVNDRWKTLRATAFSEKNINKIIDSTATLLNDSQKRNFSTYPILGKYVWPNKFIGATYNDEVQYLKNWLRDRINWLDNTSLLIDPALVLAKEPNIKETVEVYPNPTTKTVHLILKTTQNNAVKVLVYNMQGKLIPDISKPETSGYNIDFEQQKAGYYFINLVKNGEIIGTKKIIKL